MRVCAPSGLVMALTLGLILMMSHEGECRGHPQGLPPGLGTIVVAAGSTARMHGLASEPGSPPPAPSPLPSTDDSVPPDMGPPSDMEPSTPSPTPSGPVSTPPSPEPSAPSATPPASPAPSIAPLPSSPGPSQHPAPPPQPLTPSPPLVSPHPSPSPQSPTPPPPLAAPPQSASPPAQSPTPPPPVAPPKSPPPNPSTPPPAPSPTTPSLPPPPSPGTPSTPPSSGSSTPSGLQVGFYKTRCPVDVEALIATLVEKEFMENDPTILPALLRMQFHDCFVHGCDASILIDGTSTEKTAGPNLSVRGYQFIEDLKVAVEQQCPGIVSCADIVAIATKAVLKLGGGPDYPVETGRRDGLVSKAEDVILPSPDMTASQGISTFGAKNFTTEEMVVLLGCHTVGIAHCVFFQDRLYPGTTIFDPNMDPSLREELIPVCPQGTATNNFTFLDANPPSSNIVDNSFFIQILNQRGILAFDQVLGRDPSTIEFVQKLAANGTLFNVKLAEAMVKLQAVDVLTGDQGQIRNVCSKINS